MRNAPVIGVTAASEEDAQPYADIVRRSDGDPWVILPGNTLLVEETLRQVGGLLLAGIGGEDSPELRLLRAALQEDMPVLGICGGMHLLNLAMGGRLPRDVRGHGTSRRDGEQKSSYHRIYISPGSKLAAIVGSGGFVRVNSRHRQGIRDAYKSSYLMASAYSLDDGVIEALESPEHDWVIGVQFQPERRLEMPPHFDRLFQGLVERAQRHAGRVEDT